MRTTFWASAWLAAAACAGTPAAPPAPAPAAPVSLEARAEGALTRLEIRAPAGASYSLLLARDSTVAPGAQPGDVRLIGRAGDAIVLVDSYPSLPGGMSYCQAGEERFLRAVSLRGGEARVTETLKLESCREGLELADPGLEWDPASATLRIHWLAGPGGGPEERALRLEGDGTLARAGPPRSARLPS